MCILLVLVIVIVIDGQRRYLAHQRFSPSFSIDFPRRFVQGESRIFDYDYDYDYELLPEIMKMFVVPALAGIVGATPG